MDKEEPGGLQLIQLQRIRILLKPKSRQHGHAKKKLYASMLNSLPSLSELVTNLPAVQETWVQSLGWEDPLEKGKAAHSNILAWRIPWTV